MNAGTEEKTTRREANHGGSEIWYEKLCFINPPQTFKSSFSRRILLYLDLPSAKSLYLAPLIEPVWKGGIAQRNIALKNTVVEKVTKIMNMPNRLQRNKVSFDVPMIEQNKLLILVNACLFSSFIGTMVC